MRRYGHSLTIAISLTLSANGKAWAEEADATRDEKVEVESYETAMLLSHAIPLASFWTLAVIGDSGDRAVYVFPLLVNSTAMAITPPIVHASHGNFGTGLVSLPINVLFAAPGWYATAWSVSYKDCRNPDGSWRNCDTTNFAVAGLVHTVLQPIAAMIDMSMATKEKPREIVGGAPFVQAGVGPLPGGGVTLGAYGAF